MSIGAQELLAHMRVAARAAAQGLAKTKIGWVTSYDPNTYTVRVRLEPESTAAEESGGVAVETNWIPILRTYGGNGWGMIAPPHANPQPPYGDMALVIWPDGMHGAALLGIYNDVERPFSGPAPGEWWLVHSNGSKLQVLNDGTVHVLNGAGAFVVLNADGTLTAQGAAAGKVQIVAAPGSGEVDNTGVVTRLDLYNALVAFALLCQAKISASPTVNPADVLGSVSVKVTN